MAARASMADIISELRLLIGDAAGGSQVFSDNELQTLLDNQRTDVYQERLFTVATTTATATIYRTHYSDLLGMWEDSVTLEDDQYATLTPDAEDLRRGKWTFTAGQDPPVLISGAIYNVYAAAAEACELWAAKEKLSFDFSADGASFKPSQKVAHLQAMAQRFRELAGPGAQGAPMIAVMVRTDVNP